MRHRLLCRVTLVALLASSYTSVAGGSAAAASGRHDLAPAVGSGYVALTPHRILDTRSGQGAPAARVGAGRSLRLVVAGTGRVPATATAVVLNVTAVSPSAPSFLTVHPTGTPTPDASNLNLHPGVTTPNLVTVEVGDGGAVQIYNDSGRVDLVADVAGYYASASTTDSDGFAPMQARLFDSRPGTSPDQNKGPLGPGGVVDLQVAGNVPGSLVPADASAVVLNVTGVQPSTDTLLRAYPTPGSGGIEVPLVSNLNLAAGTTAANLVVVVVGDAGRVRVRNDVGQTDAVVDLAGYYSRSAPGRFFPLSATRFLDTRRGTGAPARPLGPGQHLDLQVGGTGGIPAGSRVAVANLTAVLPDNPTLLRAYPAEGAGVPLLSNVNLEAGQIRAGAAYFFLDSAGQVRLRNDVGNVDALADVVGYFAGS